MRGQDQYQYQDQAVEDMSVEDYSNSPSDEGKDGLKNVDTMPESIPCDPSTEEESAAPKAKPPQGRCKLMICIVLVVVLLLVATGLGLAYALIGNDDDDNNSNSERNSLGVDESLIATSPTSSPTTSTPVPTTPLPTMLPSLQPSLTPSDIPSVAPSDTPSENPSGSPTQSPTMSPTEAFYPQNPEPANPPRGYFNYDPDSQYGPRNWHRVDTSRHWLREFSPDGFGTWDNFHNDDLTRNVCDGPDRKQSPKNLVGNVPCDATHEIRTECAQVRLGNDEFFEKAILPHKLSIISKRRPCLSLQDQSCLNDRPPMVDYPRYASGDLNIEAYSDMAHFDIKVPGEHTLEGETFDAEIQIFHTSLTASRMSSIGIPIRADGPDNLEYQIVLDEFQAIYDLDRMQCGQRQRHLRAQQKGMTLVQEKEEEKAFLASMHNITEARKLRAGNFNPYSDAFMATMFFYRYDGSITEPPCRDITWWVMDRPMKISSRQLAQTKRILFSHVSPECEKTSVHNADQSAVRPIQPLGEDREIQHCPDGSFRSDVSKGRPPAKRCRA